MTEFTCIKGGDKEYAKFFCEVHDNGDLTVVESKMYAFGGVCNMFSMDKIMAAEVKAYCKSEYKRKQKYKRMEELMLKNLSESVVIENERAYEQCLWEYKQKLEGDERMSDLNGDLKAF